jgi:hypothetical protein
MRVPSVRRPLVNAADTVARVLGAAARVASRAADFLLTGRRGEVAAWRIVLFAGASALPLVVALLLPFAPDVVRFVDPGWFLAIGFLFSVFVLLAAALIVREDYDVMDGAVGESERRFQGARAASCPAAVIVATGLVVAYLAALAWWLMAVHGLPLVTRAPVAGPAPLAYLLIALRGLPTTALLSALDRLIGDDTRIVVGPGFIAGAYFLVARLVGVAIALGFVVVALEHRREVRRFLAEILASNASRADLLLRGRRAPRAVISGVLGAATAPGAGGARQERLIAAAVDMGLREFPALFCTRLATFTPELQNLGLDRSIEMFRYRTREFDADGSLALFAAASAVLSAATLDLEPTKKLARLMASVVIFKKDVLNIPAPLKTAVMNVLKAELAKPRAGEDAALRGILRDLQAALGGEPIIVKPIQPFDVEEWIKPANLPLAGLAAQPESPSTTVH